MVTQLTSGERGEDEHHSVESRRLLGSLLSLQGFEVAMYQLKIWPMINDWRLGPLIHPVPSRPVQVLKEQAALSFAEAKKIRSRSKLLIEQKDHLIRNHQAGWSNAWWISVQVILVEFRFYEDGVPFSFSIGHIM